MRGTCPNCRETLFEPDPLVAESKIEYQTSPIAQPMVEQATGMLNQVLTTQLNPNGDCEAIISTWCNLTDTRMILGDWIPTFRRPGQESAEVRTQFSVLATTIQNTPVIANEPW